MYRVKRHKRHQDCKTYQLCDALRGGKRRRRCGDALDGGRPSDDEAFEGEKGTKEGELTPLQSDSNCTEHMSAPQLSLMVRWCRQTGIQSRDAT